MRHGQRVLKGSTIYKVDSKLVNYFFLLNVFCNYNEIKNAKDITLIQIQFCELPKQVLMIHTHKQTITENVHKS